MMNRQDIEAIFYGRADQQRRFTQDFPVLPDVWIAYGTKPDLRQELLLTPHSRSDSAQTAQALRDRLKQEQSVKIRGRALWASEHNDVRPRILFNESVVLAHFSFWELMRVAMPLTDWWRRSMARIGKGWSRENILAFVKAAEKYKPGSRNKISGDPRLFKKLIAVAGAIECELKGIGSTAAGSSADNDSLKAEQVQAFASLFELLSTHDEHRGFIWGISLNRPATTSVWRSRNAVKADAAARLFNVDTSGIRWAVLDTGIDATHPAFLCRDARGKLPGGMRKRTLSGEFKSRVIATYDFLRIKDLLDPDPDPKTQVKIDKMGRSEPPWRRARVA